LFAIFKIVDPDAPPGDPSMSLSLTDIARLSKLAQLDLDEQQSADALDKLNSIFALVEQMKSVDTTGVEPLSHPIAAWQNDLALRLRDDEVSEGNQRDAYQKPAPLTQDGLYLVPKVIE
jgi:aspartyl-tRNA(Asn)/glutamyl-tRNA(Gln) amidotransferase subunit C